MFPLPLNGRDGGAVLRRWFSCMQAMEFNILRYKVIVVEISNHKREDIQISLSH